MQFRYKIKKDIFAGGYTLHIQYQVDSCGEWKKFVRKDLFNVCLELTGAFYILSRPSPNEQLYTLDRCVKKYGSMQELVTAYILSVLKDNKNKMIKRNKTEDLRKMIDGLANNTWSDVIVIDEDEISEE